MTWEKSCSELTPPSNSDFFLLWSEVNNYWTGLEESMYLVQHSFSMTFHYQVNWRLERDKDFRKRESRQRWMAKISQAAVPSFRTLVCPSYSKAVAMVTRTTKGRLQTSMYKKNRRERQWKRQKWTQTQSKGEKHEQEKTVHRQVISA